MAEDRRWGRGAYLPDTDLSFLQAATRELEDYLLSQEIYWHLQSERGRVPLPLLSMGGLVLAMARLAALEGSLPDSEVGAFQRSISRIAALRARWGSVIARKIVAEARSHLNLWRSYLEDLAESPNSVLDRYPQDIRERVLLTLLASQPESTLLDAAYRRAVAGLDQELRLHFREGEFLWDSRLKSAFPRPDFWFLYGQPAVP
ncbi:MAG: hypothetical protein ABSG98_07760 [Anaerolineales bacterium]|jgi:hypothetical protein